MHILLINIVFASFFSDINVAEAWKVGLIVTSVTATILTLAIIIPGIPIVGTALIGTTFAIVGVSVLCGGVSGYYAGKEQAGKDKAERKQGETEVSHVSNRMYITFEKSSDNPKEAIPFKCTMIVFRENGIGTKNPTTKSDSLKISTDSNNDLLNKVKEEFQKWKNLNVLADNYKKPREIVIYTQPFPGDGTLLKFEELIKDVFGVKGVNISKSEQEYKPNEQ